ncbi:uncharacterized protein YodC (DUF2158 family) [Pedobacter africanus]|uniref:Uncharacterized protein YodC (DUF2158 family) n=1 Tax=Pedobacter africanus TaxID=151894 RepID=A0ACC6L4F2_9SPHI|nr:DUF2158 domain-containing protein [Pedobacter africanus]MDR6786387.1 uncharacterized protein YodC (DUF2158 family) [Pedobacter africanus]
MAIKFNAGDIVIIKSGSPKMTVYASTKEWVYCYYYSEEEKQIKEAIKLPAEILQLAT